MYIINGISSDICQKILLNLLKSNKIIGIYRKSYHGIKNKNLILIQSKNISRINDYIKIGEKIVFINFAAFNYDELFINLTKSKVKKILNDNLIQPIDILLSIIPVMIRSNYGRIIFLSSSEAIKGITGASIYSTSKTSLFGLSNALAKEYSRFNITSNIISLGYFKTKLWYSLSKEDRKKRLSQTLSKNTINHKSFLDTIKLVIKNKSINKSTLYLDDGI